MDKFILDSGEKPFECSPLISMF